MITFNFESVVSSNREPYNNVAAHEELKSMMSRFDRLNIFFDIDEDGYEVIKVESTYVKRFAYQLNDCLLYTSPSPRDRQKSRMPSSA